MYAQSGWDLDTVKIGGIGQVIARKGIKDGPIILFLHGGPGSSKMKKADVFSNELQKHFMVVQWDQRESGKTLALNKTNGPIPLDLMVSDTHDLIDTLLKRGNQTKLYLAAESWGTVLGFRMAELCPGKLFAYLAFSPVTNQVESEKLLLSKLLDDAKATGNVAAQNELAGVKIPFDNAAQLYYLRKWWFRYDGHPIADKDTTLVKDYFKSWSDTWLPAWNSAMERNLLVTLPKVECPVYFFLGGKDYQTNCEIAKSYYKLLSAPKKEMYWFDNASHDVLVSDAPKVQRIIINEILAK
jgi:pimeloyl-ACP methyl ester carboxylesterase